MSKFLLAIAVCFLATAATSPVATGHPSQQFEPRSVDEGYGTASWGIQPENSHGQIRFYQRPAASSLSGTERYMLFGSDPVSQEYGLDPWSHVIYTLVSAYDYVNGHIPDTLNLDELRKIKGLEGITESDLTAQLAKSPVHGNYPRLNASSFSPGDVFIRRMTKPEIEEHCKNDPTLLGLYFHYKWVPNLKSGIGRPARLRTPVYYMVIYGENGVIDSRIVYSFKYTDGRPAI